MNSEIDQELARGIAHGLVNPITKQPYPEELLGVLKELPPPTAPLQQQRKSTVDLLQFFSIDTTTTTITTAAKTSTKQLIVDEPKPTRRRLDFVVVSRFFAMNQQDIPQPCETICLETCNRVDDDDDDDDSPDVIEIKQHEMVKHPTTPIIMQDETPQVLQEKQQQKPKLQSVEDLEVFSFKCDDED